MLWVIKKKKMCLFIQQYLTCAGIADTLICRGQFSLLGMLATVRTALPHAVPYKPSLTLTLSQETPSSSSLLPNSGNRLKTPKCGIISLVLLTIGTFKR